uniref:Filamin B n=1 Tax=Terrapene triunguis TaxID=2587831 RepID=A0A674IZ56_9SAUR
MQGEKTLLPGEYSINILFAEAHIPGSPFKANIQPLFDPSKVTASGPGLERGTAGETATFLVDCSKAGEAALTIEIVSEAGVKAEVVIQNNRDGTYTITYSPAFPGTYTITIKYGGHAVPPSTPVPSRSSGPAWSREVRALSGCPQSPPFTCLAV